MTRSRLFGGLFSSGSWPLVSPFRPPVPPPPQIGPTITAPGELTGSGFFIATARTATPGIARANGGGSVSYAIRWLVNGLEVSGAPTYTFLEPQDGQSVVVQWQAIQSGGATPGASPWQTIGSGTITYSPPVAGALPDRIYTQGPGVQIINAAAAFTVVGDADLSSVTWSVTGPASVTISGLGVVSIPTVDLIPTQGVLVRAANSGQPAGVTAGFNVTVQALPASGPDFNNDFNNDFAIDEDAPPVFSEDFSLDFNLDFATALAAPPTVSEDFNSDFNGDFAIAA